MLIITYKTMIMPVGAKTFTAALQMCAEVYHTLKKILLEKGYSTAIGDEGGLLQTLNQTKKL